MAIESGRAFLARCRISPIVVEKAEDAGILQYASGALLFVSDKIAPYDKKPAHVVQQIYANGDNTSDALPRSWQAYPPIIDGSSNVLWVVHTGLEALAVQSLRPENPPTVVITGDVGWKWLGIEHLALLRCQNRLVILGRSWATPADVARNAKLEALVEHVRTAWVTYAVQIWEPAGFNSVADLLGNPAAAEEFAEKIAAANQTVLDNFAAAAYAKTEAWRAKYAAEDAILAASQSTTPPMPERISALAMGEIEAFESEPSSNAQLNADSAQMLARDAAEQSAEAGFESEESSDAFDPDAPVWDSGKNGFRPEQLDHGTGEPNSKVLNFPSALGAMPTWLTRVGLFKSMGTRHKRKIFKKSKMAFGASVIRAAYTGEELGVNDETVWLACLRRCRTHVIGQTVSFDRGELLKDCGLKVGTANFAALKVQLERLQTAKVEITFRAKLKGSRFPVESTVKAHLLKDWGATPGSTKMWIRLDGGSEKLFEHLAFQPWSKRLSLVSDLARRLLTYVSGHANGAEHSVTLIDLQAQCGGEHRVREFRISCLEALKQLEVIGVIVAGSSKVVGTDREDKVDKEIEHVTWIRERVGASPR